MAKERSLKSEGLVVLTLFLVYAALAHFSHQFVSGPDTPSPVWLPAGAAVAALLLSPRHRWPWLLAAVFLAQLLIDWLNGADRPGLMFGFALSGVVEPLVAAALVRRVLGTQPVNLALVWHVVVYNALGGIVAAGVGAVIGVLVSHPTSPNFAAAVLEWWLADFVGIAAVGGAILLWQQRRSIRLERSCWSLEGLALIAALVLKMVLLATAVSSSYYYLAFPLLYWVAMRFGPVVTGLAALYLTFDALFLNLLGMGPYVMSGVFELQSFLAVLVPSAYLVAASHFERWRQDSALRDSEQRYRAFFATSSEGIWQLDVKPPMPIDLPPEEQVRYLMRHALLVEANDVALRIRGYTSVEQVRGRSVGELLSSDLMAELLESFVRNGYSSNALDYYWVRPDGTGCWLSSNAVGMIERGRLVRIWGTQRDVTDRYRHLEELRRQANTDALTGLPNRACLSRALAEAVAQANASAGGGALLLMDLNRFKEINDTLGHEAGDELLRQVGERVRGVRREGAMVARMGGDEFALLLPRVKSPQQAREAGRELLRVLQEPFALQGLSVELAGSAGLALFPEHGTDAVTLLRRAEVAMYQAKDRASGLAIYRREHDPHSPQRLAAMTELGAALRSDGLELYFQPKVDVASREPAGLEVLVRWRHPELGLLPPSQFVPIIEVSSLVGPFTEWVLDRTLRQMARWLENGIDIKCAVNVSVRNLLDESFPATVLRLLEQHRVSADRLELEITETAVMMDPEHSQRVLSRLRELGLRLSIDDFGTGHASLAYLKRLPIGAVKIDRSFVNAMASNDQDRIIVSSTIHMAHELGLQVVAEGVEDGATLDVLHTLGCNQAQGYHISKPMPAKAATNWLRRHAAFAG